MHVTGQGNRDGQFGATNEAQGKAPPWTVGLKPERLYRRGLPGPRVTLTDHFLLDGDVELLLCLMPSPSKLQCEYQH